MHFLLTFQEVMPISKTRNQLRHLFMSITIESLPQEDVCSADGQTADWNVVAWELVMERERGDIDGT